ncbi:MAG: 4Fe-4S dicluster domain-containing protein [Deltaproteobacteria bacterium]|nr:4Fe-4S dicluster domain-containing protein [Deltaproteobacteria bacterium]
MAKSVGTVVIEVDACKGCELCIPVCPPGVLSMSPSVNAIGFRYPILRDGCTGCELCAEICPDYCFEVFRAAPSRASAEVTA